MLNANLTVSCCSFPHDLSFSDYDRMHPVKKFAVIEFPGLLRDPDDPRNAIAALGGEESVRTCVTLPFAENVPPLTLNLRDGLRTSPSNIVAEKNISESNLFALKVTRIAAEMSAQALEQDDASSLVQHSSDGKDNHSRIITTILGQVTSRTSFRSIADFQYHPRIPSDVEANNKRLAAFPEERTIFRHVRPLSAAGESLFPVATKYGKRSRVEDPEAEIDRLRPARFVRGNVEYGNTDYWFRQFCASSEAVEHQQQSARAFGRALIEDRRSDARRLETLHHRIQADAERVPSEPHPSNKAPLFRGRESFDALYTMIADLFQARPIWIRRALYEGVPDHLKKSFKRAIVQLGYCFQGPGPFYQAWIRYGYDPRKDPYARKYQVIEVRCGNPVVHEASKRRRKEFEKEDTYHDEFKLSEFFVLSGVPLRRHNFVQLCDIKLPEVIEFCKNEQPQPTFDKRYGYFTAEGFQELNAIIRNSLIRLSSETIGKGRVNELLKDYRTHKDSLRKKKKRTNLIDVMKREASHEPSCYGGEERHPSNLDGKPRAGSANRSKKSDTGTPPVYSISGENLAPDKVPDLPPDAIQHTPQGYIGDEKDFVPADSSIAIDEMEDVEGLEDVEGIQIIEDDDESENDSDDFLGENDLDNEGSNG